MAKRKRNMEIIAEIGQNHNGDLVLAKEMISAAKESNADVAKFQIFDAEETFGVKNNPWIDYHRKTQLKRESVEELYAECESKNIEFLASILHERYITWLEQINVKRYKIASRSIYDNNLINSLIRLNKPLIVSLGYWKGDSFPKFNPNSSIDFLYCVSKYPTEISELNLNKINFREYSGFSDHSLGTSAAKYALVKGAKIIEKHFTIDKTLYGPDQSMSIDPKELKDLSSFRNDLLILK